MPSTAHGPLTRAGIVIIGGGPAAASTALQLARRGLSCKVLEAASQFQEKPGESLAPNCARVMALLGLEGVLQDPAHLACHGNQYIWGSEEEYEKHFLRETRGPGWHLNRAIFEAKLAASAQAAGVDWQMDSKLSRATSDGQTWQLSLQQHGCERHLEADFVVDATGRSAKIARACSVERIQLDRLTALSAIFDLQRPVAQFTRVRATQDGWWYCAPLSGQRMMTVFASDSDLLPRSLRQAEGYWLALQASGFANDLQPRLVAPQTRLACSAHLQRVAGHNWLAVGDAAFAYDPLSSYGITAALGAGYYAGNAIADYLQGKDEALAAYGYLQAQAYTAYLQLLAQQYRQEQRWPDAPFWQRRHAPYGVISEQSEV